MTQTLADFWIAAGKPARLINRSMDLEVINPEIAFASALAGTFRSLSNPRAIARMPWWEGPADGWEVPPSEG